MRLNLFAEQTTRIALEAGLLVCLFAFWRTTLRARAALSPAWVELGPGGAAFVRIVVSAPQDLPDAGSRWE